MRRASGRETVARAAEPAPSTGPAAYSGRPESANLPGLRAPRQARAGRVFVPEAYAIAGGTNGG